MEARSNFKNDVMVFFGIFVITLFFLGGEELLYFFNILNVNKKEIVLLSAIVSNSLLYFLLKGSLLKINNEEFSLKNIFLNFNLKNYVNFILALLLVSVMSVILDYVPRIFKFSVIALAFIKLIFIPYIIIDKKTGLINAFSEMFRVSRGRMKDVLKFEARLSIAILLLQALKSGANYIFYYKKIKFEDRFYENTIILKKSFTVVLIDGIFISVLAILIVFSCAKLYKKIIIEEENNRAVEGLKAEI